MNNDYYILKKEYGLRCYENKRYCVIKRLTSNADFVAKKVYDLLLKCDGNTLFDLTKQEEFIIKQYINKCNKGEESLDTWQKEIIYDNRYLPNMNIQLTGKCNYNCLHCFNAVDNAPLNTELSYEDMIHILDEAKSCGVLGFTITGGEPLIHKRFIDIMKEIYKRDMMVFELNTNGFFITKQLLDEMKSFNMNPTIKISFDGIGYHDWMRNHKGAEEKAVEAMKLCIKEGFETVAQINVNKVNVNSMKDTLDFLASLGLAWARFIPTVKVPRWAQNGKDNTFEITEYFDFVGDLVKYYITKDYNMDIVFWHAIGVYPKDKKFEFGITHDEDTYYEERPLCKGAYHMMAIGSNGNVYPCLQVEGVFESLGTFLGNIKTQSLHDLLTDSDYQRYMTMCVKEKTEYCKECRECIYLKRCGGGCPCLSLSMKGHRFAPDVTRCTFFKNEYDLKYIELLKGYKNITGAPYKCN